MVNNEEEMRAAATARSAVRRGAGALRMVCNEAQNFQCYQKAWQIGLRARKIESGVIWQRSDEAQCDYKGMDTRFDRWNEMILRIRSGSWV